MMFLTGTGALEDHGACCFWLRQAAIGGLAEAQFLLGALLRRGLGDVPISYEDACRRLEEADGQGRLKARLEIAAM